MNKNEIHTNKRNHAKLWVFFFLLSSKIENVCKVRDKCAFSYLRSVVGMPYDYKFADSIL